MTEEELNDLNVSLWKEWTLKATEVNCCKLCCAVVDDETAIQFLRYIQGFGVSDRIRRQIDSIARGELILPGLDCTLRGIRQKNHLMYKIEPLEHPTGNARYEFLVEYDRMEPNVGIYLGCKCVTAENADHREMIKVCVEEWKNIRDHICTVLNNSFPDKEFRHRFRITDNGQEKTFWPTWIGLYDDEDMEFALTVLRIFRKTYEQYFNGTLKECRHLKPIAYRHVAASFTESTFMELERTIAKAYGKVNGESAMGLFQRFILNASFKGIFSPDPSYDLAWRYMGDGNSGLTGSNIEFATLMRTLIIEIGARVGVKTEGIKTPWNNIFKVFLDSEGVAYNSATRTQWQNALDDTVMACENAVRSCLDSES